MCNDDDEEAAAVTRLKTPDKEGAESVYGQGLLF